MVSFPTIIRPMHNWICDEFVGVKERTVRVPLTAQAIRFNSSTIIYVYRLQRTKGISESCSAYNACL